MMKLLGTICLFAVGFLTAFTIMCLYNWHVVPFLPTAPILTYNHSMGICLLIALLQMKISKADNYGVWDASIIILITNGYCLLVGWLLS